MAASQISCACFAHRRSIRLCRALLHRASPALAVLPRTVSLLLPFNAGVRLAPVPVVQPVRAFCATDASSSQSSSSSGLFSPRSSLSQEELELHEEISRLEMQTDASLRAGMNAVPQRNGSEPPEPPLASTSHEKMWSSSSTSYEEMPRAIVANPKVAMIDNDEDDMAEDFSSDADIPPESASEPESELDNISASSDKPSCQREVSSGISGDKCLNHPWKEWNAFLDMLYKRNYFSGLPRSVLEESTFLASQTAIKHAVIEFSRERDDIIRFLTKKHIKTVVVVGCPSTDRKVVNASKRLRLFCEVPEEQVCQQCKLKTFCIRAYAAPDTQFDAATNDITRVLLSFAANAYPNAESQVSYPLGVVKSACHILDEIVRLSGYPRDPTIPAAKPRMPFKQPSADEKVENQNSNQRNGDWTCPDCNFLNFSRNRECRECGTFREHTKPLEPGDWECPECTFVNFRRNKECRECSTPRPPIHEDMNVGEEELMPGDWKCPKCQFVNFRRNSDCYKCSARRPPNTYPAEELEPGDWRCPKCSFRNFRRNTVCRDCGTRCPDDSRQMGDHRSRGSMLKPFGGSGRGWGSGKSLQSLGADKAGAGWKPCRKGFISDGTDDDLEEDADVVFDRVVEDDEVVDDSDEEENDGDGSNHVGGLRGATSLKGQFLKPNYSERDSDDLDEEGLKWARELEAEKSPTLDKFDDDDDDEDEDDDDDDDDESSSEDAFSSSRHGKVSSHSSKLRHGKESNISSHKNKDVSGRWDDDDDDGESDISDIGLDSGRHRRGGHPSGNQRGGSYSSKSKVFSDFSSDDDNGSHRKAGGSEKGRGRGNGRGRGGRSYGRIDTNDDNHFSGFSSDENEGSRLSRGGKSRGRGRGNNGSFNFSSDDNNGGRLSRGRGGRSYGRIDTNDDNHFSGFSSDENEGSRLNRGGKSRGRGRGHSGSFKFSSDDNNGSRLSRGGRSRGRGRGRGTRGRSFEGSDSDDRNVFSSGDDNNGSFRGGRGRGRGRGRGSAGGGGSSDRRFEGRESFSDRRFEGRESFSSGKKRFQDGDWAPSRGRGGSRGGGRRGGRK